MNLLFLDLSKLGHGESGTEAYNEIPLAHGGESTFIDKENENPFALRGGEKGAVKTPPMPLTPPVPEGFSGIPNGNRKFSEHKGITTHATPFEERIERALKELDDNNLAT